MIDVKYFKHSLSAKVLLAAFTVFSVMMIVSTSISYFDEKERSIQMVQQQVVEKNLSAFDSLNMLMISDSMEERETLRSKLIHGKGVLDVRFLRADAMTEQYGEGDLKEHAKDVLDKRVLAGDEVIEYSTFNGERAITVGMPFKATENNRGVNCLDCHDVAPGTVNGGIRLTMSLEPVYESINNALIKNLAVNLLLSLIGLFLINALLKRLVTQPLAEVSSTAKRIASGDMSSPVNSDREDEVGHLFAAMRRMQTEVFARLHDEKEAALRIKASLDQVNTPVQIIDTDYNVFYLNQAAQEMFVNHRDDFSNLLKGFNPDKVMGSCVDLFHKDPSHQRRLLDGLSKPYVSDDLTFCDAFVVRVAATPVLNNEGKRIAIIVEWIDRSAEVRAEKEVGAIVEAAQHGDLSQRINLEGKEGFFIELSNSLNALSNTMEQAVDDTIAGLEALEAGDLTHRMINNYEGKFDDIKRSTNHTFEKLNEVIGHVQAAAEEVGMGSGEITEGNLTLSSRTQEQATALEETAASIEEITGTVQQTADNSRQANQLAVAAREQAEKGGNVASEAIKAMAEINASSRKIADIIGVIDEISFQTNLLALNAAVEAARAGEQGRGFAVVAGEVRTLAQRSAEAAKEIKTLINSSVQSVDTGSKLVNESGDALNEIVGAVAKVGDIIAEIAAASVEQSSGIDQINKAIAQLDAGTQQNSAMVEESAAASQRLNDQSNELRDLVSVFQLDGEPKAVIESKKISPKKITGKTGTKPSSSRTVTKKAAVKQNKISSNASNKDDVWEEF